MKTVLRARRACPAPGTGSCHAPEEATAFLDLVGFPVVAKPPDGAGAHATYRLDDPAATSTGGGHARRGPRRTWLLEEFLTGTEHTFDSGHRRRADRVGVGLGLPAAAAGGPAQPVDPVDRRCSRTTSAARSMPRSSEVGPAALQALGIRDALLAHGVVRAGPTARSRSPRSAPGRPARRSGTMIGFAHDVDFFRAVGPAGGPRHVRAARAQVCGGAAYLRGRAAGRVRAVHGVEEVQRRARAPGRRGAAAPAGAAGGDEL